MTVRAPQPLLPNLDPPPGPTWYHGAPHLTAEPLDLYAATLKEQPAMTLTRTAALRKDQATAADNPAMQHRHFAVIAATIACLSHGDTGDELTRRERRLVAHRFADMLYRTNPRFDRSRFLAACGLAPEDR